MTQDDLRATLTAYLAAHERHDVVGAFVLGERLMDLVLFLRDDLLDALKAEGFDWADIGRPLGMDAMAAWVDFGGLSHGPPRPSE